MHPETERFARDHAVASVLQSWLNGRIGRREVTTGATDEQASLVEIMAGLEGGETVIIGPASGLQPGQRVTVTGGEG